MKNNQGNYPLSNIYFYLTEGCNLACSHCWLNPKIENQVHSRPVLSVSLFKEILQQANPLGLRHVKLTGGEPLMHPHISEILGIVHDSRLSLAIETNGVLCTRTLAKEIAAGTNSFVSVSLDGVDACTHEKIRGVKGCFTATIAGIHNLVKAGIRPQIIMTLMQQNKKQIPALICLAEALNAGSVKFNLLQPTGRGKSMKTHGETLPVEELILLGHYVSDHLATQTRLKLYFDWPAAFRKMSDLYGKQGNGCISCSLLHSIGVLADGSYALCGIGNHLSQLVYGHASSDPLAEIWNHHEKINTLREGLPSRLKGVCSRCHMRGGCSASCIAQNYYRTGNLWSPFWFCEEADQKGLFPATRLAPEKIPA